MTQTDIPRKLSRSRKDGILAGICGGLGEYVNIDPIIFRILFIVLIFVNGIGVILYVLLWIVLPNEDKALEDRKHIHTITKGFADGAQTVSNAIMASHIGSRRYFIAGVLIAIGAVVLVLNLLSLYILRFDIVWPIILILIGLYLVFKENI